MASTGRGGASSAGDRIVAAARRLFPRTAYCDASMDDLAEEAGLAQAPLYLQAIYAAVLDLCRAEIEVRTAAAEQARGSLADRLTNLIYAYIGTALEFFGDVNDLRDAHLLIKANPAIFGPTGEQDLERRIIAMLDRAFRDGEIASRVSLDSSQLAGVLLGVARGAKIEGVGPAQYRARVHAAVRLIMSGLAAVCGDAAQYAALSKPG